MIITVVVDWCSVACALIGRVGIIVPAACLRRVSLAQGAADSAHLVVRESLTCHARFGHVVVSAATLHRTATRSFACGHAYTSHGDRRYLSKPVLARVLGSEWRAVSVHEAKRSGHADLIVIDGAFWIDKSTHGLHCGIKSRMDTSRRSLLKYDLHKILHRAESRFIPECFLYDRASPHPLRLPPGVWIWRPTVRRGGGQGVAVVETQRELDAQVRRMAALKADRGVLTRYVRNPQLFHYGGHGYKLHLRLYFVVVALGGTPGLARSAVCVHCPLPFSQHSANVQGVEEE